MIVWIGPAMVLDALFGEPDWLWSRVPHPAVAMGRAIAWVERRWNSGLHRRLKGALAVGLLVSAAGLLGTVLSLGGPIVETLVTAVLLAQRSLVAPVRAVALGLGQSLQAGRDAVAMIVSRDTAEMSVPQVTRSAIESAAENLSDGVIAPIVWAIVGGLPGLLIYKLVNTADSMIGYRTPRYEAFGWAAARLDDLLNLVPARLTAALIAVSFGGVRDVQGIFKDANRHRSPNAGWPEAVMARGLGIALAGPRSYDGALRDLAWVHPDGRRDTVGPADIDGAIRCLWRVWAIGLCLVLAAALL